MAGAATLDSFIDRPDALDPTVTIGGYNDTQEDEEFWGSALGGGLTFSEEEIGGYDEDIVEGGGESDIVIIGGLEWGCGDLDWVGGDAAEVDAAGGEEQGLMDFIEDSQDAESDEESSAESDDAGGSFNDFLEESGGVEGADIDGGGLSKRAIVEAALKSSRHKQHASHRDPGWTDPTTPKKRKAQKSRKPKKAEGSKSRKSK